MVALAAAMGLLALGACQKMDGVATGPAADRFAGKERVQFGAPLDKVLAADNTTRKATVQDQSDRSTPSDNALAIAQRSEEDLTFQAAYMFDPITNNLAGVSWQTNDVAHQGPLQDKLVERYGPGRAYHIGQFSIREWEDKDKNVIIRSVRVPDRYMTITFTPIDEKAPGEKTGIITLAR